MLKYLFFAIIAMVLLLASCQPDRLAPKEYLEWVENPSNHFQQKKLIGENEYIVQYGNIDYIYAQQALQSGVAQAQKRREEEDNEFVYLKFRIQDVEKSMNPLEKNVPDEETYYQRLNYLAFGIEEDILFLEGTDIFRAKVFSIRAKLCFSSIFRLCAHFRAKRYKKSSGLYFCV